MEFRVKMPVPTLANKAMKILKIILYYCYKELDETKNNPKMSLTINKIL